MARREAFPRPTDGELEILRVLWAHGDQTVREIHERLEKETGYTTVLKLLQIMTEKGLVRRDESRRSHVYRASQSEREVQDRLVADLARRAFDGSAARLALRALADEPATPEELDAIRALIERRARGEDDVREGTP